MIKIGLVGCGRISKKHLEAISTIPEFKLTAVCDSDPKALQETLQKNPVQGYTDYAEFLEKADMDIVDICTPSGLHPFMGMEAAKKGYHVILEKPMGLSYNACLNLVEYCEQNNRQLFVVKQNRYNSPVQILKEAIVTGRLGKLITCNTTVRWRRTQEYYNQAKWRGTWEFDGGVLMNQASHHVDLLLWLGGEVKSVYAKAKTFTHKIEVDDTATVMLEFENGCLGTIEATTCTSPVDFEGSVTFLGENGLVRIGGFAVNRMEAWKFMESKPNEEEEVKQFNYNPPNVYGFGHNRYLKNVANTLLGKEKSMTNGREGLKTLKLLLAIYESVKQKKEIVLSEYNPTD